MTDTNTAEREAFIKWMGAEASTSAAESIWSRDEMLARAFKAGRASLAASEGSEPVARVNDDGFIVEIGDLLIAPGQKLYTHPSPPEGMAGWRDIATAPKDEMYRDGSNAYAEYILVWYPGAIAPIRARWWQSDSDKCNFLADGGYAVFPTVWQPTPAPPLPASEAKEL